MCVLHFPKVNEIIDPNKHQPWTGGIGQYPNVQVSEGPYVRGSSVRGYKWFSRSIESRSRSSDEGQAQVSLIRFN